MGEIIIKHREGGETDLHAKSRAIRVIRAEQRKVLLGEDIFTLTIQTPSPVVAEIGDKIDIFGGTYTINQLPTITKTGTKSYEQTLTFEGMQSELLDVQFILPGNTMYDDLTGDAGDFLGIIVQNANRVYPGKWAAGTVPENTETKTLSFAEKNCLAALQEICEEWGTEFEITMSESGLRTIHLKQVGVQFPFTFKYGRTGGLYELSRKNINSKNVVTRLYVYGGSRNLGRYRSGKLCLPNKLKNQSYIENAEAITLYGLKENVKTFDEIYPVRYGLVTALGESKHTFTDDTMDFDLNEVEGEDTKWLIPGISAKVRFTTGNLAGYEFDLHKYDHATKEIQIIPFMDENGYKFPSETSPAFQMQIGDQYHFIDINLPDSYIENAEEDLEDLAIKYYDQYKQPQVQYSLSIHPRFLEKYTGAGITNIFSIGDQISVLDEEIGVDKTLRIVAFTRDAVDPFRYTLTLSEATYTKTIINRIIDDIEDIEDIIIRNNLADPFRARRNWMAAQELLDKIFDPEGYYYSEKIRPLSIETMMLQVGAKSQQFILQNTRFEPNYEGNPNRINIIGGQLIHYTVNDTITPWTLNSTLVTGLQTSKSYFVYAKCERQGGGGVIIVDETQYMVDQDPNFYYFVIGHLSSVITNPDGSNGARILSLTYGSTTINGRFIKTGRIESSGGGYTYFDLDEGIIGGRIRFLSGNSEIDLEDWTRFIEQDLDDIDDLVIDLEDYIDNAFHDGIIEEAEAVAIEKYLNQIRYEKVSLEANYNKLILSPLLTGDPKTNLLNSKITFFGTTENLINTINAVIADGRVTESEKQSVDAVFSQYRIDSADFSEKLELANQAIQQTLKDIADGAADMAADAQATANLAKAITDKFGTTIDGGLIQTVIVQFREANSEVVTAGTSGIQGAAKDQPALWAGGSYEDAISGVAKAIIRHDGSAKFTDAEITGIINANSGSFSGALASPFERTKSTYTKDFSNNLIVTGSTFILPWDQLGSGRLIRLIQPNPGSPYCTAPTGKYFYEDGVQKNKLTMLGAEIIELLGYTDSQGNFTGWLVLNRGLLHTVSTWGEPHRIVAHGRVKTNDPFKYHTFDGSTLTVSTGEFNSRKYTSIIMPEEWFDSIDGYYVKIIANGADSASFHTVGKNTHYAFRVYQHSLNVANGTLSPTTTFDFYFEIYSAAWLYPKSGSGGGMPGEEW
ncbi:MAG: phage tail protein [Proteiniphilum sp.]